MARPAADLTPAETAALLTAARLIAADTDTRSAYLPGRQGAALDRAVAKLAAAQKPTAAPRLLWEQVEPRRRYRAQTDGKTYHLIYQGRASVGPDLTPGWYLEGGLSGRRGHEFMARRLHEAADAAARLITDH